MVPFDPPVSSAASTPDSHAVAIAGAEERLAMLRRLASLGMRLAEEVCERAINAPYHPEPAHEPARVFATVSRAVRLTLVLQAKVEAKLIALLDGKVAPAETPNRRRRDRAIDAALDAGRLDDDVEDGAPDPLDPARENLCESECFDEILSRPFADGVAAIRADLGLAPGEDTPPESAVAPTASGETMSANALFVPPRWGQGADVASRAEAGATHPPDSG